MISFAKDMMKGRHNTIGLSVSPVKDSKAFQGMKVEWNVLLEESEANNIFLTWEWMYTWWEIYGQDYELYIITVRNPLGELVGIAPFKVSERGILRGDRSRALEFIGWGGDVPTEYLDIIAKKGWETKVLNSVAEYIFGNNTWTKVDLHHLSSTSPSIPVMKEYMKKRGVPFRIGRFSICPIVVLPESWEEFLSWKSVNFRKKTKEYRRTSLRDLGAHLIRCDSPATLQEDMDALIKLHRKRWGRSSGAFRTKKYVTFHRRVSRLFLENNWLRLFFLKQEDKTLAGIYCFHHNKKYYYYQSGRDTEYPKYRLGMVLLNEVLKEAIKEKAGEFDLLTGEEAYKYRWAHYTKETVRLSSLNNGYGKATKYFAAIQSLLT
jgi:CelD/BcsL family acetyltransferase involved in cellulose biosynthesis